MNKLTDDAKEQHKLLDRMRERLMKIRGYQQDCEDAAATHRQEADDLERVVLAAQAAWAN